MNSAGGMPQASLRCSPAEALSLISDSSPLLGGGQHLPPQNCIDAGLISLALGFQPLEHVGIDTGGDLALDRPVEHTSPRVLELVFPGGRGMSL